MAHKGHLVRGDIAETYEDHRDGGDPQDYRNNGPRVLWEPEASLSPEIRGSHTEWMDGKSRERIRTNTQIHGKRKLTRGKRGGKKKNKRVLGT